MIAAIRRKKQSEEEKQRCPVCQDKCDKAQAAGVILLMVTAIGCGVPGIITIPLMIYFAIQCAIPCEACRKAKRSVKTHA